MNKVALCLPLRADRHVLLGWKQRGFGAGKLVALGGKLQAGESAAQAASRELWEEAGLMVDVSDLQPAAQLAFLFPARPVWDHAAQVFVARCWQGESKPSEEMAPHWVAWDALPFAAMWDDSRFWLPRVLAGEYVRATYVYGDALTVVAQHG